MSGDLADDDPPPPPLGEVVTIDHFANGADNAYQVVIALNVDDSAILDGFTITAGRADGPGFGAVPESKEQGSGLNVYFSSPTIINCTFLRNWSNNHGAVNDHGDFTTLIGCTFRANYAHLFGAGMYSHHHSASTLIDCTFRDNFTPGDGVGPLVNISNTPTTDDYGAQIALDANDKVHIVWQRGSAISGPLGYVHNISGSFVLQDTGVGGSVIDPKILISNAGVITILYRPNLDAMMFIENAGGGFTVPAPVYTGAYRSAFVERPAVDVNGFRYVAFASNIAANHGTFFVRETAEGWQEPQLLQDGSNQGASVAVNAAGKLVVSYQLSGVNNGQVYADIFLASASLTPPCVADIAPCAGDGMVNVGDLLAIINSWGPCPASLNCPADIAPASGDGVVNVSDLLAVINAWGRCQ